MPQRSSRASIGRGIRFLLADRMGGRLTPMSIEDNLILPDARLRFGSRVGRFSQRRLARQVATELVERFGIKVAADVNQLIARLNDGNQQKVMLAACADAGRRCRGGRPDIHGSWSRRLDCRYLQRLE